MSAAQEVGRDQRRKLEQVFAWLDRRGVDYLATKRGGGHVAICLRVKEQEKTIFSSSTPGDMRAQYRIITKLRSALNQLGWDGADLRSSH